MMAPAPKGFRLWLTGMRPRTLTIAASPVIMGAGLAFYDIGALDWPVLLVTIFCAMAIQAGTNLYNDAADTLSGNDKPGRPGPARLTAMGWAKPGDVKLAALVCFGLAALGGVYLVWVGGWPILIIGLLSIICGYAYSAGPAPLSHTPLSELFVIVFFGVSAVGGTYFLQAGIFTANAIVAGISIGLFAAGVLMVNNHRDRVSDRLAGRKTLAIMAGPKYSRYTYGVLVALPFFMQGVNEMMAGGAGNWLPLLPAPFGAYLILKFFKTANPLQQNMLLVQTAKLQFAFAVLFALGLVALKIGA